MSPCSCSVTVCSVYCCHHDVMYNDITYSCFAAHSILLPLYQVVWIVNCLPDSVPSILRSQQWTGSWCKHTFNKLLSSWQQNLLCQSLHYRHRQQSDNDWMIQQLSLSLSPLWSEPPHSQLYGRQMMMLTEFKTMVTHHRSFSNQFQYNAEHSTIW